MDELLNFGEVRRGWLGVGIELVTMEIAQQVKGKVGKGVWVNSVFEGDPAHRAGIRIGDVILKIGGTAVDTPGRMIRLIGAFSPGQSVNLDILRDGRREVVTVKLENQKKKPDKVVKKSFQDIDEPSLGLEVESLGGGKGIIVSRVYPGSTADGQGLKVGDRIEAINGRTVLEVIEYIDALDSVLYGGKIYLLVLRNKDKFHFELTQKG